MRLYNNIIGQTLFLSIIIFSTYSCSSDAPITIDPLDETLKTTLSDASPSGNKNYFKLPKSSELSKIPQDPNNVLTAEKVALGAYLFHETGLSSHPNDEDYQYTYSCATCHNASAGFQSGTFQAIREGGLGFGLIGESRIPDPNHPLPDVQSIRTPSAMNIAYQKNILWNGQFGSKDKNINTSHLWKTGTPLEKNRLNYDGAETQAIAGQDVHRLNITPELLNMKAYKNMFDEAFPSVPQEDRYSAVNAGLAIAAYERTLLPYKSPWQQYLDGNETAMSDEQKEGAILFFGKANCVSCHTGPALSSMEFYALGAGDMVDCIEPTLRTSINDKENRGRASFTNLASDEYKFKVPQIYNLRDLKYLGHGATFKSVEDIIRYKNDAIAENSRVPAGKLSPEFVPLGLSNDEINKLTQFVKFALYDDDLERYVPELLPSGLCFPNGDAVSKNEMGCE